MLHNVKSGQKVWCIDTFGNIHNAVVNKTVLVKRKNKQITYVRMSEADGHQNNQGFSIDACYPSREALLEGEKAKSDRQVQLYCEKNPVCQRPGRIHVQQHGRPCGRIHQLRRPQSRSHPCRRTSWIETRSIIITT